MVPTVKSAPCLSRAASALHLIRGCQTPWDNSRASVQPDPTLLARVIWPGTCAQRPKKRTARVNLRIWTHLHVESVRNHAESLRELTHERVFASEPCTELNKEDIRGADPRKFQFSRAPQATQTRYKVCQIQEGRRRVSNFQVRKRVQ